MDETLSLIPRAYQLARSGTCKDVEAIIKQLTREGHTQVKRHLASGSSLRQDLRILIRVTRAKL